MLTGSLYASGSMTARVITFAHKQAAAAREARAWKVRNAFRMLATGELLIPHLARLVSRYPGLTVAYGTLTATVTRRDGTTLDLGLVGHHLVTTAGKNYLASTMDNTVEPESLKYHAVGTGTTAAALGDTALQTECTTALNPDSTRAVGSQAHSTNTYTSVGTLTFDASAAVTEWGLLSATSAGTMLDRQVFAAVNVAAGDSIQFTYVFTQS